MRELDRVGVGTAPIGSSIIWSRRRRSRRYCRTLPRPLDEIYEPIRFGELEYSPSTVLESVDKIAFDMGCNDYANSEIEDGRLIYCDGNHYRMDGITD